jgi:hypothetical protein
LANGNELMTKQLKKGHSNRVWSQVTGVFSGLWLANGILNVAANNTEYWSWIMAGGWGGLSYHLGNRATFQYRAAADTYNGKKTGSIDVNLLPNGVVITF